MEPDLIDKLIALLKENFDKRFIDVSFEEVVFELLDKIKSNPKVIDSDMIVYFDVDDTLVMWDFPKEFEDKTILFDNYGVGERLLPHFKHIDQLKRHKARGHKVVVWSAGGYSWADSVVKTLNLQIYVDLICCKPQFYYDDLTPNEILPLSSRVYYDYKVGLETTVSYVNDESE